MDRERSNFIETELPRLFPPPAAPVSRELGDYARTLARGGAISPPDTGRALEIMIEGRAAPYETALFLSAFDAESCGPGELAAMAGVMRDKATPVNLGAARRRAADIVGTGGDGLHLFNISTAAMFILAAAGLPIAKHGNRASTSRCGSADVLEELGVRIDLPPDRVARSVERTGLGFIFAPLYHPAMKNVSAVRKELPFRTVFNVLGPLCNPAGVACQLLGVYTPSLLRAVARALPLLGVRRAVVVCGSAGQEDGWMDEVSTSGPTRAVLVEGDKLTECEFAPARFGVEPCRIPQLSGGDPRENAAILRRVLDRSDEGPRRDICLVNTAACLFGAGKVKDLREGMAAAREAVESREALRRLEMLIEESNQAG